MAEMAQQPPEALGTAHVPVGDDEDTGADTCARCRPREPLRPGKRMTASLTRGRGKIRIDVEEARAGDVARKVELAAAARFPELPATVDELVAQTYQLPPGDAGSGTDAGWIT